jgi:hypothetical protein
MRVRTSLEVLDFENAGIGTAGLRALASVDFPRLAELRVHGNSLDDRGIPVLLGAPFLPRRRRLFLGDSPVSVDAAQWLARIAHPDLELQLVRTEASYAVSGILHDRFGARCHYTW